MAAVQRAVTAGSLLFQQRNRWETFQDFREEDHELGSG
jgi:hypothetical protein